MSFQQSHTLEVFLVIPVIFLRACNALTFHSGLNLPCVTSVHRSIRTNTTETYQFWKLSLVSWIQSYWLGTTLPAGIQTACGSQEAQNWVLCHSYIMRVAVGWCRHCQEIRGPWCGSRQPAVLRSLPQATVEAFAVSDPWVITGVPPLPSAFQVVWYMSCGSYLLESMSAELIRSGMLASFLVCERRNTYLGISFICGVN